MVFFLKFILTNIFFWKSKKIKSKKNEWIIVEYTMNPFMNFALLILAYISSIAKKSKIMILITPDISIPEKYSSLIYKAFRVNKIYYLYDFIKIEGRQILYRFREAKNNIKNVDDLYNFKYNDVLIGDLLYDLVLRNKTHKATISEINDDLDDSLYSVIATLYYVDYLYQNNKIVYSVFSHPTMLGGVIQRYLLIKYNLEGLTGSIHTSISKINKLIENRNPYPAAVNPRIINEIIGDKYLYSKYLKLSNEFINQKENGEIKHHDSQFAFSKKSKIFKDKLEFNNLNNLDVRKPNVFLSLHVFNDQPNTYESLYKDYFIWMKDSIDVLIKNEKINLIIKEHPSTKMYPTNDFNFLEYKNRIISIRSDIHFISSDDNFNTTSIKYIADYIITSGGSIALEAAFWGVPSLICSYTYYSEVNLVKRAESIEEYHFLLSNLNLLEKLDEENINKAKIVYYVSNAILWDGTWNNDVFFPKMTFEEKTYPDMDKIISYYLNFLKSKECRIYVDQMVKFIQNDNSNIFFRDPELAKLEEN